MFEIATKLMNYFNEYKYVKQTNDFVGFHINHIYRDATTFKVNKKEEYELHLQ